MIIKLYSKTSLLWFSYILCYCMTARVSNVRILGFQRWGILRQTRNFYEIPTRLLSLKVGMSQPTQDSITKKLTDGLKPSHLNVINESYMHNVPKGSETHFKVVVVSEEFDNVPLLQRHRMVNQILEKELQSSVHALSIQYYDITFFSYFVQIKVFSANNGLWPKLHSNGKNLKARFQNLHLVLVELEDNWKIYSIEEYLSRPHM